jgi:hypothetical protein
MINGHGLVLELRGWKPIFTQGAQAWRLPEDGLRVCGGARHLNGSLWWEYHGFTFRRER